MGDYANVFERCETKYLLQAGQYAALLPRILPHLEPDAFPESRIGSIYFDTPSRLLIRRSLEKPVYKEKLRLRAYAVPGPEDMVFLEMKKKFRGTGYKRRALLTYREAMDFLKTGEAPQKSGRDPQILRELAAFLAQYPGLGPSMFIGSHRLAYRGREREDLRITFDRDILFRETELELKSGFGGAPLLAPGQWLMEVKLSGAAPLWLASALSALAVYPSSYSKYGAAYALIQKNLPKEAVSCA